MSLEGQSYGNPTASGAGIMHPHTDAVNHATKDAIAPKMKVHPKNRGLL